MKDNPGYFEEIAEKIIATAIAETMSGSGGHHSDIDYDKLVERITRALVNTHNKALESAAKISDDYHLAGSGLAMTISWAIRKLMVKK
jgi:hypothetical protein